MATSNALPSLTFYTNPLVRVPAPAALDAAIRPTQERASLADSLQQRKGAGIVMRANREQATRRSLARRPQKAHRWQPQPVRSTIRVRGYVWVVLPQAFNPAKVALMLAEKGFPHRTVKVDLFAGGNLTPEFLKMSPKGWTPVLVVDDKVVLESKAICKLVDGLDKAPLGGDEVDRAAVDQLVEDIDKWDGNLWAYAHSPAAALSFIEASDAYRKKVAAARAKQYPDMASVYEERVQNMSKLLEIAKNETAKVKECDDMLTSLLDKAEARLKATETDTGAERFLGGSAFSIADAMFAPVLYRVHSMGQYQQLISPRPGVSAYLKRLRGRPSWQAAFGEASSTWGKLQNVVPALLRIKVWGFLRWY